MKPLIQVCQEQHYLLWVKTINLISEIFFSVRAVLDILLPRQLTRLSDPSNEVGFISMHGHISLLSFERQSLCKRSRVYIRACVYP